MSQMSDDSPTPPAGFVPPQPTPPASGVYVQGPNHADSEGYTGSASILIPNTVIAWTPAIALTFIFFLTFFSWVGTFPGDYRMFTQRPWDAMFGHVENHQKLFKEANVEIKAIREETSADLSTLFPYLACLIISLPLVWLDRLLPNPKPESLPPMIHWLPAVTERRVTLMIILTTASFVLLVLQVYRGFGLEHTIEARIAQAIGETDGTQEAAEGEEPAIPKADPEGSLTPFQIGETMGRYNLQTTTALMLALLLQFAAMAACWLRTWLDNRPGSAPPLKLAVHW